MAVESPIGKQIREVLATSLRRDPSSIKPHYSLRDDLGLDSLTTFELLYDLEKAFDLEIPNDDLPGLQTLDDMVKYVEKRVNPDTRNSLPKAKKKKPALPIKSAQSTPASKKKSATTANMKQSPTASTRKVRTPSNTRAATTVTKRAAPSKKRTATSKPQAKAKKK